MTKSDLKRHAVLLVNNIGPENKYPRELLSSVIAELEGNLSRLGEFSFACLPIRDQKIDQARQALRQYLRSVRNDCDLLLFYYFGHAVIGRSGLRLLFRDSDADIEASMLGFDDVVHDVRGFGINRAAFILDCCYAGAGADPIGVQQARQWRFFLMAAATGTAEIIAKGRPIGIFTSQILRGFREKSAAEPLTRNVTFNSLFRFARESTKVLATEQEPYCLDGGLGAELLFLQNAEIKVLPYLNEKAPRKSSYNKLYLLCTYLTGNSFATLDALYAHAKRENDVAFQTPIRTKRGSEYQFMSISAFAEYVDLLHDFNAMDGNFRLTSAGTQLISRKGMKFNETLWTFIQEYWKNLGFTASDVIDAITDRVRLGQEPTASAIRRFLFQKYRTKISPGRMKRSLDLAGYTNAIPYCSEKTFYPLP